MKGRPIICAGLLILLAVLPLAADYQEFTLSAGSWNYYPYCNIVVSPDGAWALVANPDRDEVVQVNLTTLGYRSLQTGDHPAGVTLSPDGGLLGVMNVSTLQTGAIRFLFSMSGATRCSRWPPPASAGILTITTTWSSPPTTAMPLSCPATTAASMPSIPGPAG